MNDPLVIDTTLHWAAVVIYVIATIANVIGLFFKKDGAERLSYWIAALGLVVHGAALLYRWNVAGHGPYMVRYEVLSSNAWAVLFGFLVLLRIFPRIRPVSIMIFPSTFLLIALSLFFNPGMRKLPPTLKSIWLVLHVIFYKISLTTILVALTFSVFLILKKRTNARWLDRFADLQALDTNAYRFAGFSFTFWAIAMLAGSIWAYESWGRFWGWDPIETWSLITWVFFGIYLHLRRFFGWRGEKAAYFYMLCFLLSIISLFFTSLIPSSIHSEYFQ